MANRFWVGGSGNWSDDTNHWASTSGGIAAGGNLPTSSDDVFFDSLSNATAYTVTIDATTKSCKSLTFAAPLTGNVTWAGSVQINISGSMTLYSGLIRTYTGTLQFNGAVAGRAITFAGTTIGGPITINGIADWTFQDALSSNDTLTLTKGTLDTNGKSVTVDGITSGGVQTRVLTLGASAVTIASTLSVSGSGLTVNGGTSVITALAWSVSHTGLTFYSFTFSAPGNSSFAVSVTFSGTLTYHGTDASTGRGLMNSTSRGTAVTITAATVDFTNLDIQDITAAGAANWNLASITGGSGDCHGNTGITFTTPVNRYWVGDTGSYGNTSEWSATSGGASGASVPLPQDTAYFDNLSFSTTGFTVTQNMPRIGKMDWSAVTNSPTLTTSTICSVFGDMLLSTGIGTFTASTQAYTFEGRGSYSWNSGGKTFEKNVSLVAPGGTLSLAAATTTLGTTRTFTLTQGTIDANGKDFSMGKFVSNGALTRAITMGSGTWTTTGTVSVWNLSTTTGLTFTPGASTLVIGNATSTGKNFDGGGLTYATVTFSGDNVTVTGNNTFGTLNVNNAGLTNGLKMTSGSTQTVTNFATNGSAGNLAKLSSAAAHNLSKSGGTVSVDYMSINNSLAAGGAAWYAGANSTDATGNTGWIFTAPPAGLFLNRIVPRQAVNRAATY